MNPFEQRIASGEISSLDQLKAWYRAEAKRLHPDLQGTAAPGVDFDRLKQQYHEAHQFWLKRQDESPSAPESPVFPTTEAFLEEFRNLVARGFPVNVQAAAKNRAYTASIRRVATYLAERFGDADFFVKVNAETRALKRREPTLHWYVLQIYWNIGDYQVTGFDYYRRIYARHLDFIREPLAESGHLELLKLLEFLVGDATPSASTRVASKSPRPGR